MQKAGTFIFILLIALAVSGGASAEQNTLIITLDSPVMESDAELQDVRTSSTVTPGAPRPGSASRQQSSSVQVQPTAQEQSTAHSGNETPIGRVAITTASSEIRRLPNRNSAILFRAPKDTHLALTSESGDWYGVLMVDSSMGWIEKKNVNLLDYQVVGNAQLTNPAGNHIVKTATKYLGIRYQWGGYSLNGLDCSGFVKAVFESHGISLPRVSRDQAQVGIPITGTQLQPGDRLYFASKGTRIDHTGIYMGSGYFIHSASSRGGVVVDSIQEPKWSRMLVSARRS